MLLPTAQEITALHRKYAPTTAVFDLVFTHCRIVSDIAVQLIHDHALSVDSALVEAGCLLHDIGVYPLFDENGQERADLHYITHGIRGESILKHEGLPETIWQMASHHTGVGLTAQVVREQRLALPVADYSPKTTEERLVMYADKFHSKTTLPYFNSYEWYLQYIAKFGTDKPNIFKALAIEFGIPDLQPLIKTYKHQLRQV
jgi:uncharacterized protein